MNSKEVSEILGLSIDTMRYYEKNGLVPPVMRDRNGYRIYRTNDLNWLFLVKSLRNAGLSIATLTEFADLARMGNAEKQQKELLHKQLSQLDTKLNDLNAARNLLAYKIDTFDEHIAQFKAGIVDEDTTESLWNQDFSNKL